MSAGRRTFDILPPLLCFKACLSYQLNWLISLMETEIFTLCDFAQDAGGKLTIVGTFDQIGSKTFPVTHPSCSLACRLRFSEKEQGTHDFKLRLVDIKGKEVIPSIEGNI